MCSSTVKRKFHAAFVVRCTMTEKDTQGNEFITQIKETSVAGYIGIMDLTKASDIIASRTYPD